MRRVVVGAVLAALVWSVLGLAGVSVAVDPFRPDTTKITAIFPRTVGLYPKSRVRVDGIDAGWVTKVEPQLHGVKVDLEVHDVAIAGDATAALRLKSMIGERYIELGPVWNGKGPKMKSGTTLRANRVRVPAEISDVLDEFTRLAEGVDKKAIGKFVHELATAVDGRQDDLAAMVSNFADVGRTVQGRADDIDRSMVALSQVMGTLADRDDNMVRLMHSAAAVSDALLAHEGAMDASISGVNKLLDQVNTFTRSQKEKLVTLLDGLDRVGTVLAKHDNDFGQVVETLPQVAYNYIRAVDNDGQRWYTINNPFGILFLPTAPNINSRGGPGSDREDHTFLPTVDWSNSAVGQNYPHTIDLTGPTGSGPLLPSFKVGPDGNSVCHDKGCDE